MIILELRYDLSLDREFSPGDELSGGNVVPSEPVVWRQGLQWQNPTPVTGRIGLVRREPGSDIAPQRHVNQAEDVGVMINWNEAWNQRWGNYFEAENLRILSFDLSLPCLITRKSPEYIVGCGATCNKSKNLGQYKTAQTHSLLHRWYVNLWVNEMFSASASPWRANGNFLNPSNPHACISLEMGNRYLRIPMT